MMCKKPGEKETRSGSVVLDSPGDKYASSQQKQTGLAGSVAIAWGMDSNLENMKLLVVLTEEHSTNNETHSEVRKKERV